MNKVKQLYRYTNPTLMDAYNRVAIEVYMMSQKKGYKSFSICGSEPLTGATSVAINLAIALSMGGWKTLLIDADLHKTNKRLSDNTDYGLSECLAGEIDYQQAICATEYAGLHYMPGGSRIDNPISLMCSNKLPELLEKVNSKYDYIIWDLPSVQEAADTKVVCSKTEATILVSAQYASKDLLKDTFDIIRNAGGNVVGVIGNKLEQTEYDHYRKIRPRKAKGLTESKGEAKKNEA